MLDDVSWILAWHYTGEGESSMMLALRPDLCDMKAMETLVCPPEEDEMMNVRGVYRWQSFADYTPTGVLGVPSAGEHQLDACTLKVRFHPSFFAF